jgi:hypothetical protein
MGIVIDPIRQSTSIAQKPVEKVKGSPLFAIPDQLSPAPAAIPPYTISKPKLTPPQRTVIQYDILNCFDRLWNVGNDRLSLCLTQLDKTRAHLDEVSGEHTKSIKEAAIKTQEGKVWSLLRKIGNCVLAAFSFFFGASISAVNPIIGGLLIASGILNIANLVFSEAGLWNRIADKLFPEDEEKKRKFIAFVPAAIGIIAAGCGAVGGIAAFFKSSVPLATGILAVVNMAVNLAEGVTSIGEGIHQKQVASAEAKLKFFEKEMFNEQMILEKTTGSFEGVIKLLSDSYAKAAHLITMSIRASSEITA